MIWCQQSFSGHCQAHLCSEMNSIMLSVEVFLWPYLSFPKGKQCTLFSHHSCIQKAYIQLQKRSRHNISGTGFTNGILKASLRVDLAMCGIGPWAAGPARRAPAVRAPRSQAPAPSRPQTHAVLSCGLSKVPTRASGPAACGTATACARACPTAWPR